MGEYYRKESQDIIIRDVSKKEAKKELINSIKSAIVELDVAHENYNIATGELVDYYSYQIKAVQAKYDYLIRQIKNFDTRKTS